MQTCLLSVILPALHADNSHQSKIESERLTNQARDEMVRHNFKAAFRLIQKAIALDPGNEKAKSLYINLSEFVRTPPEAASKGTEPANRHAPEGGTQKSAQTSQSNETEKELSREGGEGYIQFGIQYAFGSSNYLNYVHSDIQLAGGRIEGGFFLKKEGPSLGVVSDFSSYPVKTKGNSDIDIIMYRADIFLCGRLTFAAETYKPSIVGLRTGYHYFYLQNKKSEGAYYFRQAGSLGYGLFVSDQLFCRFLKAEMFKYTGFEGGIECIPIYKKGNSAIAVTYNADLTFQIGSWVMLCGWRSYEISDGKIKERFSDIEYAVRYIF
jgi:hypothetical protein